MKNTRLVGYLVAAVVCHLAFSDTVTRPTDTPINRDVVRRVYRPNVMGHVLRQIGSNLETGSINVTRLLQDMDRLNTLDQTIATYLTDRTKQRELQEAQRQRDEIEVRVQRDGFALIDRNGLWTRVLNRLVDQNIQIAWNQTGAFRRDGTLGRLRTAALQIPGVSAADINRAFPNTTPAHLLNNDDPSQLRDYRYGRIVDAIQRALESIDNVSGDDATRLNAMAQLHILRGDASAHDYDVLREIAESPSRIREQAAENIDVFRELFGDVIREVANRGRAADNRYADDMNGLRQILRERSNDPTFKTEVARRFYERLAERVGEPMARILCTQCFRSMCSVPQGRTTPRQTVRANQPAPNAPAPTVPAHSGGPRLNFR